MGYRGGGPWRSRRFDGRDVQGFAGRRFRVAGVWKFGELRFRLLEVSDGPVRLTREGSLILVKASFENTRRASRKMAICES